MRVEIFFIKRPVLRRFRNIRCSNVGMRFEVCDRTRDFQNSVVTAGGQCQRFKYSFQQERRVFIEFAAIAKQIPIQACVAGDACSGIPLYLDFPRGADAPADRIRGLAFSR